MPKYPRKPVHVVQVVLASWLLLAGAACGSSADVASTDTSPPDPETVEVAEVSEGSEVAETDTQIDDCDFSTFVYTPFDAMPDAWPSHIPVPDSLVEVRGDVGVGCERVTVDMRAKFEGPGRPWFESYAEALEAAGFDLIDEYDDLGSLNRLYRSGDDAISYGGEFELVGSDSEYFSVGIVITDFS